MKRISALLLAMALLAGIAAGCGSAPSEPAQSAESASTLSAEPEAPVEEALPEASEEPEESDEASEAEFVSEIEEAAEPEIPYFPLEEAEHLSMWFAYPPIFSEYADGPEEYLIFTEASARLNLDLEVIGISMAGANEQFNLMIASGEYPDIIERFGAYYQNSIDSAMDDEIALELTEYLDDWAPEFQAVRTRDEQTERITATADGRVAGFYTFETNGAPDTGPFVRTDYLDALDLEIPETLDDWGKVLEGFSGTYGAGLGLPSGGTTKFASIESNFGVCSASARISSQRPSAPAPI